ncbi:hypothetical protein LX32DRAFT_60427 [Colletotrichum zoysiae]|uniref:NAD-specific glutamate dehydrogenase n=1 Tax=Colletotrichum zoysiae TaxID=1216348 RepID=A0AAD9LY76_9PEZI|nr:hypothetical protein LX32DRAFT_60427 [Colletotrichum zoysiae]
MSGFFMCSVSALVVLLVDLGGLGAGVDGLGVLAHAVEGLGLADVGADEGRVLLDGGVAVLDGAGELEQLDEGGGAVAVAPGVVGRALDHLRVGGDGAGPVALLELLVAVLAGLLGLGGVDVGQAGLLDLVALGGAQLGVDLGGAVLRQGLFVVLDGQLEVALLLVGGADARVRLGDQLEVGVDLAALLDGLGAGLDGLVVVALLEVGGAEVVEVGDVLVQLPGLAVVRDGLVKVSLLVVLGTQRLLLVGLLLGLLLGQGLLVEFFGFGLGLGGGGLLGGGLRLGRGGRGIAHLGVLGNVVGHAHLHVDAHQDTEDLQHAGVGEQVGRALGVLLHLLELGHEGGVCEETGRLGVGGELLDELGVVEHVAEAASRVAGVCSQSVSQSAC